MLKCACVGTGAIRRPMLARQRSWPRQRQLKGPLKRKQLPRRQTGLLLKQRPRRCRLACTHFCLLPLSMRAINLLPSAAASYMRQTIPPASCPTQAKQQLARMLSWVGGHAFWCMSWRIRLSHSSGQLSSLQNWHAWCMGRTAGSATAVASTAYTTLEHLAGTLG